MPADYYQVPGLPYPQRPQPPRQPVDPNDLLRDTAMDADVGMGAQSPRDPYMANLPPRQPTGPTAPSVTTIAPGRTTPFSRADAQALAALDPRALEQAKALAAMPESTPRMMTGRNETTGESFQMQPSARVDRNALARLYAGMQQKQSQERQDAVRAQEQGGKERLATIPGESAVKLAEQQGKDKIGAITAEGEVQAPTRQANIAKSNAEIAALQGKEKRDQGTYDKANDPNEKAKADAMAAITQLEASGLDKTTEGRKTKAALLRIARPGLPAEAADAASAMNPQDALAATQEFAADPEAARLIADIQKNKQGVFSSNERWQKKNASRRALDAYINRYAAAKGIPAEDLRAQIEGQLIGVDKGAPFKTPFGLGD